MFLLAVALLTAMPALAQVEQVAARTRGLSCGACGAIAEIYLRRLPEIDKVTLSTSRELALITYKPGTQFDPWAIRDALERTDVDVLQFQISARGVVSEQGGKKFFLAGKDKFELMASPESAKIVKGTPLLIEGIVDDRFDPMQLKILVSKPAK